MTFIWHSKVRNKNNTKDNLKTTIALITILKTKQVLRIINNVYIMSKCLQKLSNIIINQISSNTKGWAKGLTNGLTENVMKCVEN